MSLFTRACMTFYSTVIDIMSPSCTILRDMASYLASYLFLPSVLSRCWLGGRKAMGHNTYRTSIAFMVKNSAVLGD